MKKTLLITLIAFIAVAGTVSATSTTATAKKVFRSLTVQKNLTVKGNLNVKGNFNPKTIVDILGSNTNETTWKATIYRFSTEKETTTEVLNQELIMTFNPSDSSESTGTFTSEAVNVFFTYGGEDLDGNGSDDYTTPATFTGQYEILGNALYITDTTTPPCLDSEDNIACNNAGLIKDVQVLSDGKLAFYQIGETVPGRLVILEKQ